MSTTQRLWSDRFSYSGEIPTNYPGLRPRAIARINEQAPPTGAYWDGVDDSRYWQMQWDGTSALWGRANGRTGGQLQINAAGANYERGRLQLNHFSNLWPPSNRRRVLIGGWFAQTFNMAFNPLINTRDTDPFVYLSTAGGTGDPRAQVYNESGQLIFDQYESGMPWRQTTNRYFLGFMVDGFDNWVQMFSVHSDGRRWLGPRRTLEGTPNWNCTADVELFSLRSGNYWESGYLDDVVIANPDANFSLETFVDDLGNSVWADGYRRPDRDGDFTVTDDSIRSDTSSNRSFSTGASRVSWTVKPSFSVASGNLLYSTDDGASWQDANRGSDLPETADGILLRRENMTLSTGTAWSGQNITIPDDPDIEVTPNAPSHNTANNTVQVNAQTGVVWSDTGTLSIPQVGELTVTASPAPGYVFPDGATTSWSYTYTWPDPPTLGPIADVEMEQGETDIYEVELDFTAAMEPYSWQISSPTLAQVSIEGGRLYVAVGFETGTGEVTVTLRDGRSRTATRTFSVTVTPRTWDEGPPPNYPHAPIVLWEDGHPEEVLVDPLTAEVIEEVNGPHVFEFVVSARHEHARLIYNENIVEVAGERYWIRRVTTERWSDGTAVLLVYSEQRFYELSTMGGVEPQEWNQVLPGPTMQTILQATPWRVGTVTVGTRRTYELTERTNPLEVLYLVQDNHGGDLIFDNESREVHLLVQSGRSQGVGFFYGSNLSESKRVEDTTSLVTRIYARNADGLTIASVNDGRDYVENYDYTDELKTATYNFQSGASPYMMLEMVNLTLENRSKPDISYELKVSDQSEQTQDEIDRFACGDIVTVSDPEIGIDGDHQRIVRMEYNILEPWASEITLSAKLRETGASTGIEDRSDTGAGLSTMDLVPFNHLLNARFDNGLAHWANSGVEIVETNQGTGDYAVRFAGSGTRWIEQTFTPDNRFAYTFSFEVQSSGFSGTVPDLTVEVEVEYEDGDTETFELELD